MTKTQRGVVALLVATQLMPVWAQTAPGGRPEPAGQPTQAASDDVQPKFFIWGLVFNFVYKVAMETFKAWRAQREAGTLDDPINYRQVLRNASSATIVSSATSAVVQAVLGVDVSAVFGSKGIGAEENTVANLPTQAVTAQDGQVNYQGVHVALVAFANDETYRGVRPVTAGFTTGERFKVKLLPTYDALVVIENITPQGVRRQVYPPQNGESVFIRQGVEIFLPLRPEQYFEFAGATGDDQLVITVRDPRATGDAQSKAEVSRSDEDTGSNFVQETPEGTYPVIAQSIHLSHNAPAPRLQGY